MSELSHESTADPPKKDEKDVKSLAHDIERVCVSSEATGSERAKNKESSKNDIQESEHSEEAQSPIGRSDSKENYKEFTPAKGNKSLQGRKLFGTPSYGTTSRRRETPTETAVETSNDAPLREEVQEQPFEAPTSGNENHTTSTPPPILNLDNTEENDLQSNEDGTTSGSGETSIKKTCETILNKVSNDADLRKKVKEYLDNPGLSPESQKQPFNPPRSNNENMLDLVSRMNEERKSTNNQLTREMLKQPGIYYLKFTTSTGICRGYVGQSLNVYERVRSHVNKKTPNCLIDTHFKKTCEGQSIKKWHLRVVMLNEIQVEGMKDLLKFYKDVHDKEIIKKKLRKILTTIETLAMIDLNTVYPNGYNCKLEVSGEIWCNDPLVNEQ